MMAMTKRSGDGGRSRFALEFSHLSPFGERLRLQLVYDFNLFPSQWTTTTPACGEVSVVLYWHVVEGRNLAFPT